MTGPTTQDEAQGISAVENLMQVLLKALRAVQLYLPNNPVYQKACENTRNAFAPVWEQCTELDLDVTESDLVWEGNVVLSQPSKAESMAWVLFKDGIRFLSFSPGIEEAEIIPFLTVINKARTLPDDAPNDLLTLLWEQEFQHVRYEFVELGVEDMPALEGSGSAPTVSPEDVRRDLSEASASDSADAHGAAATAEADRPPGIVKIEEMDSTLYFLDKKEIDYLESEIRREYKQDLRGNVLTMLFDLLELQSYSTVRSELISILENFIPYLLAVGDFHAVAFVLREIHVVLQRARELLPEHRQSLKDFPGKLSEPDSLGQLLQALDEALVHPTEEELGELFRELRPDALQTLLAWLPKLSNERVRNLLGGAARRLARANPDQLVDALKSEDEAVLLETIRLAGELELPPVVPALGQLLKVGGIDVRRLAVEALASIGTPGAMKQLEAAIDDEDREVRIGVVRAMANHGYRGAFPKIEAAIRGKGLRDADLTEKTAFFEAYGLLAGSGGIALLQPMIGTKGFMRRKQDPQTRACAAMALGKIATPEAKRVLEGVTGDKDPLVRNAVSRALREIA